MLFRVNVFGELLMYLSLQHTSAVAEAVVGVVIVVCSAQLCAWHPTHISHAHWALAGKAIVACATVYMQLLVEVQQRQRQRRRRGGGGAGASRLHGPGAAAAVAAYGGKPSDVWGEQPWGAGRRDGCHHEGALRADLAGSGGGGGGSGAGGGGGGGGGRRGGGDVGDLGPMGASSAGGSTCAGAGVTTPAGPAAAAATAPPAAAAARAPPAPSTARRAFPRYKSYVRHRSYYLKFDGVEPDQLQPDWREQLAGALPGPYEVLVGAYVRRGCVELVLEVEVRAGAGEPWLAVPGGSAASAAAVAGSGASGGGSRESARALWATGVAAVLGLTPASPHDEGADGAAASPSSGHGVLHAFTAPRLLSGVPAASGSEPRPLVLPDDAGTATTTHVPVPVERGVQLLSCSNMDYNSAAAGGGDGGGDGGGGSAPRLLAVHPRALVLPDARDSQCPVGDLVSLRLLVTIALPAGAGVGTGALPGSQSMVPVDPGAAPEGASAALELLFRSGGEYLAANVRRVAAAPLSDERAPASVGGCNDGGGDGGGGSDGCVEVQFEALLALDGGQTLSPGVLKVDLRLGGRPCGRPLAVLLVPQADAALAGELREACAVAAAADGLEDDVDELLHDVATCLYGSRGRAWDDATGMAAHLLAYLEQEECRGLDCTARRVRAVLVEAGMVTEAKAATEATNMPPRDLPRGSASKKAPRGSKAAAAPSAAQAAGAMAVELGGGFSAATHGSEGRHAAPSTTGLGPAVRPAQPATPCPAASSVGSTSGFFGTGSGGSGCRRRGPWLGWGLLPAAAGPRGEATEAQPLRSHTATWSVAQAHTMQAVEISVLLVLLRRSGTDASFLGAALLWAARAGVSLFTALTGLLLLLLPRLRGSGGGDAWRRLAVASRWYRYPVSLAAKALALALRVPAPWRTRLLPTGIFCTCMEGVLMPATCLLSPRELLLLSAMRLPLNAALLSGGGAYSSNSGDSGGGGGSGAGGEGFCLSWWWTALGLKLAVLVEVVAMATTLACHACARACCYAVHRRLGSLSAGPVSPLPEAAAAGGQACGRKAGGIAGESNGERNALHQELT